MKDKTERKGKNGEQEWERTVTFSEVGYCHDRNWTVCVRTLATGLSHAFMHAGQDLGETLAGAQGSIRK